MGVIYDNTMLIKIPSRIKEEADKQAKKKGKTLSSYVRDLIVKDLEEKI